MIKKSVALNQWLWKWHFIAGLISLPVVLVLSVTGLLYLFKEPYEAPRQKHIRQVQVTGVAISFEEQFQIAQRAAKKKLTAMVLPASSDQATEFLSGRFSHKNSYFVDPYQRELTGSIITTETDMHAVRKLHGELLLGKVGTLTVELVGSWMVVLIITGLYVWWPTSRWSLRGFFIPRLNMGKRIFFRDLHAVTGFWMSVLLLMTLAGGLPWTDKFGSNFSWLQKKTNTGYPANWENESVESEVSTGKPRLSLDTIVSLARALELPGEVEIQYPKSDHGVFSVSNTFFPDQRQQQKIHIDQFTGKQVQHLTWADVGILMRGRMWLMAFHQGQFGDWNWLLMAFIAISLTFMSASALVSYLLKQRKKWNVPEVPDSFRVGYVIISVLIALGLIFPMFGMSVVCIAIVEIIRKRIKRRMRPFRSA